MMYLHDDDLVALTVESMLHEMNRNRGFGFPEPLAYEPRIQSSLDTVFIEAELLPLLHFLEEEHLILVENEKIYKLV